MPTPAANPTRLADAVGEGCRSVHGKRARLVPTGRRGQQTQISTLRGLYGRAGIVPLASRPKLTAAAQLSARSGRAHEEFIPGPIMDSENVTMRHKARPTFSARR